MTIEVGLLCGLTCGSYFTETLGFSHAAEIHGSVVLLTFIAFVTWANSDTLINRKAQTSKFVLFEEEDISAIEVPSVSDRTTISSV